MSSKIAREPLTKIPQEGQNRLSSVHQLLRGTLNQGTPGMKPGTAAWKIALWSSLAFAVGTAIAFLFLQQTLASEIQQRADAWLTGELGVLADVAQRTPADRLHDKVVREVAELASREIPHDQPGDAAVDRAVFFLELTPGGDVELHTGAASGLLAARALSTSAVRPGKVADVRVPGFRVPFRVAEASLPSGDRIYLALSSHHERKLLHRVRVEFGVLWFAIILLGSLIVYASIGRMLRRVQKITETAETIGRTNLSSRVPATSTNDEISRLSITLNRMLDRVEASVQQLHAMSDALAHDLRNPLTAIRGKLEFALLTEVHEEREASIAQCIDEVDRLSSLLNMSLDVSEANADALRLRKENFDLDATLRSLVELYEPSFAQAGLSLRIHSSGTAYIFADAALVQRTLSNLLDNALEHLAPGCTVSISIRLDEEAARLIVEDDGAGFPSDLLPHVFDRHAKGPDSSGFGLGLAFVQAVVRSHEGSATAENIPEGGARIQIQLPLSPWSSPTVAK